MKNKSLIELLRFYFITDYESPICVINQVSIAIKAGATAVQYRNKNFSLSYYEDVIAIQSLCHKNRVLFIVNDNILLAKSISADGVHIGQNDVKLGLARNILGFNVIIGLSISTLNELKKNDIKECDYIGVGPVFDTKTKIDAKPSHGLTVFKEIVKFSSVPVVAIGGINSKNIKFCMEQGADGIAVISCITHSNNPIQSASEIASLCLD